MAKKIDPSKKKRNISMAISPQLRQIAEHVLRIEIRPNMANLFEFLLMRYADEQGYLKDLIPSDNHK